MIPAPDHIEASRLIHIVTAWERRFHEYEMLLTAGIAPDEAVEIVTAADADRRAELISLSTRAVVRSLHEALTAERIEP